MPSGTTDGAGHVIQGMPAGATPFCETRISANAEVYFNRPGVPGKNIYITGVKIFGTGATAGLSVAPEFYDYGPTNPLFFYQLTYAFATGAQVANTPLTVDFYPPIVSGTGNTVEMHMPASGAGGLRNVAMFTGYIV